MAACRRSARLAPLASAKPLTPSTDLSKAFPLANSFTGESLAASVKAESCTSPYEVREQGPQTPTPKSSSKRKLSFVEALGEAATKSRNPTVNMNLETKFSPSHVVVKQEVEDSTAPSPELHSRRGKRTARAPKNETLVAMAVKTEALEAPDTKRPSRRATRAIQKPKEEANVAPKPKIRAAAKKKAIKKEDEAERPNTKQEVLRDGGNEMEVALLATGAAAPVIAAAESLELAVASGGPYPTFPRPYPEECYEVRNRLIALHGLGDYVRHKSCPTIDPVDSREPPQVLALEYRPEEQTSLEMDGSTEILEAELQVEEAEANGRVSTGSPSERRTVLDSLIGTILSQNTTDNNSRRAFAALKEAFPTWEEVHAADPKAVEDAIRCGGLAETKAKRIINILDTIFKERGLICLEYVRTMTIDQIKEELSRFKGVGPKTVACVLMFHLQQNEFPVDTHVFRLSKMLGWVPANADREKTYLHMNSRVPDELKYDLHCLLVTHGKRCPRCAGKGRAQTVPDGPCPLINWSPEMALENGGSMDMLKEEA